MTYLMNVEVANQLRTCKLPPKYSYSVSRYASSTVDLDTQSVKDE